MPNLTMGHEGHQFHGDGVSLSWPKGGERQVVPAPDAPLSLRIKQRIAEGQIRYTDEEPNRPAWVNPASLITGRTGGRRRRQSVPPVIEVTEVPSVVVHEPMDTPEAVEVKTEVKKRSQPKRRSTHGRRVQASRGRPS